MKKILFVFTLASLLACNSAEDKTKIDSMSSSDSVSKQEDVSYPYSIGYSSKFEISDSKNSQTLLELWKAWDNGDLLAVKDKFADSVEMYLSDGMVLKGTKDSVLANAQNYRNMFASVKSSVDAIIPTKSIDKNQEWVCIWGTEVSTDRKGKTDSVHLQETWRLDKQGKVDFMLQYAQAPTPPKK